MRSAVVTISLFVLLQNQLLSEVSVQAGHALLPPPNILKALLPCSVSVTRLLLPLALVSTKRPSILGEIGQTQRRDAHGPRRGDIGSPRELAILHLLEVVIAYS